MRIVVASKSRVKLEAVRDALGGVEVVGVATNSGVPEQPLGDETVMGARNRAADAMRLVPGADLYVAIENGIFFEDGQYIDRSVVVVIADDGAEGLEYSRGVELPREIVEEARMIGFDTMTVGRALAERGIVARHDDPHADLGDKTPRARILRDAVLAALTKGGGSGTRRVSGAGPAVQGRDAPRFGGAGPGAEDASGKDPRESGACGPSGGLPDGPRAG
jgi:inosine/xanthosine triphosphatase